MVSAIIIKGGTPTDIYSCENHAPSVHLCAKCLYIAQCTEMHENQQGFTICSRCSQEEENASAKKRREAGTYHPANTHAGHKAVFNNLHTSINLEAERCGVSTNIASTRTMPAWEITQQYALANGEWYDGYCGMTRRQTSTSKNPFQPSLDAVFPYTLVNSEITVSPPRQHCYDLFILEFPKVCRYPGNGGSYCDLVEIRSRRHGSEKFHARNGRCISRWHEDPVAQEEEAAECAQQHSICSKMTRVDLWVGFLMGRGMEISGIAGRTMLAIALRSHHGGGCPKVLTVSQL